MPSTHSRRRLLASASSLAAVALAGCFSGSDDDESDDQSTDGESDGSADGSDDGTDDTGDDGEDSQPEPVDWTGEERGTVSVGRGGLVFDPDSVRVRPGTTVRWLWEGNGHNVVPVEQPDGADWAGEDEVSDEGYSYEFTFETPGTYEYVCEPHQSQGMRGYVVVTDD